MEDRYYSQHVRKKILNAPCGLFNVGLLQASKPQTSVLIGSHRCNISSHNLGNEKPSIAFGFYLALTITGKSFFKKNRFLFK